jgi:hypothetical protein
MAEVVQRAGRAARQELAASYEHVRSWLRRDAGAADAGPDPVDVIYQELIAHDPAWAEARLRDTIDYYARLDRATFEDFLRIFGPHEYIDYHRYRLAECFTTVTRLIDDTFGASEPFTFVEVSTAGAFFPEQMGKRYGDRLSYAGVDFPAERGGTGSGAPGRPGDVLVEVDLNRLDHFRPPTSLLELVAGRNVIVLASEIIEHLLIDVGHLVRFWRTLVDGGRGHMVVTTPNFHAEWRLAAMLRGVNPLERYTDLSRVASGYVHIREYAAKEVLAIDPLVPGTTCAFSFAMPGSTNPQLSEAEYFARAARFAVGADGSTERPPLMRQMLGWEGLAAIYPFG